MQLPNIPWRALPSWLLGSRLRILMYHSISENRCDPHAIPPTEFERQMRYLQSAQVISLREGIKRLGEARSLKDTWVITFDDALLDFYTTAMPILSEFGYPVSLFVPTGLVGKSAVWDSYDKSKPLMNWEQLRECQRGQVSFGSHTVNHVRLTECDEISLVNELYWSLTTLQNKFENVLPALAFPGGYHDARIRQVAGSAGYICALGASSHWGNGSESDLFQLRRERMNQ